MLYIDEATSGLDAGTEARMMRLFRQLADDGKSVLCITHNVDNVDLCHLIIVLLRGKLVFYGPPAEARPYFGVTRISEIYDTLAKREPAQWEEQFQHSALFKEFVDKRLKATTPASGELAAAAEPRSVSVSATAAGAILPAPPPAVLKRPPFWHQFCILTLRYLELIVRDKNGLRLLLLQAPIVALVILAGFAGKPYEDKIFVPRKLQDDEREYLLVAAEVVKENVAQKKQQGKTADPRLVKLAEQELLDKMAETKGPVVPDSVIVNPRFTYMLLFLMVIIVLWCGCNNASKEIVKEEAIYGRERAVNLGIVPYLTSKFLVLSVITSIQALLLMVSIYAPMEIMHVWGFDFPHEGYRLSYAGEFGVLVVLAMTGVAMGLMLSAVVASPDQANTLLPYVLIPQIILGGGILPVKDGPLYFLAILLSPAYWAYRALHRGTTKLPPDVPVAMDYNDNVLLACGALAVQMALLLGLVVWFLRRKDVAKA
jgi:hypothetical protein